MNIKVRQVGSFLLDLVLLALSVFWTPESSRDPATRKSLHQGWLIVAISAVVWFGLVAFILWLP